jgi:hypothetical protein
LYQFGKYGHYIGISLQSGFVLSGLAITIPELDPGTHAPVEPMLQSKSVSAIGDSVATKESTERFNSSASRAFKVLLGPGKPRTVCKTRLLITKKDVSEFMATKVILKLPSMTGEIEGRQRRSIL